MLSYLMRRPLPRLVLIGLLVASIQTSVFVQLRPFGVIADLLVGFAVATGLAVSPEAGVIAGFVFGMMIDLLVTTPFGLSGLCYGLAAFVVGAAKSAITVAQAWWLSMLLVGIGSAAAIAMYGALGTVVGEQGWFGPRLIGQVIVIGVMNALLAPLSTRAQRWAMNAGRDMP